MQLGDLADAEGFEPSAFGCEVLDAVAAGRVSRSQLQRLADAVLDDEPVRLALRLRDALSDRAAGRPIPRAIELAAAVLAAGAIVDDEDRELGS